jgi:hypothetical protein
LAGIAYPAGESSRIMSALTYLSNRPDEILDALRRGEIVALETAVEQLPDFFLLYALESGLLGQLADTFPVSAHSNPRLLCVFSWRQD